jgi:aryl-alcohol dehydrogenase-like predicted oxidoreductase
MDNVRLGAAGLKVSPLCLGMMSYSNGEREWHLDEAGALPIVAHAAEQGINFFDTADTYASGVTETITGNLLRTVFTRREDYVLSSKVGLWTGDGPNDIGLSRKHILAAIDASLARLGTDHVDLYVVHRWDPETPIEETMGTLHDVVRAGKARYLGASSMCAWQFAKAQRVAAEHGWTPFVSMQNHYNLMYREEEREMIPLCVDQGVAVTPWSPLARGWLAGNRTRDGRLHTTRSRSDAFADSVYGVDDFEVIDVVQQLAAERSVPPAQIALAWLHSKSAVTAPVLGATAPSHVDDAVASLGVQLSDDDIKRLEAPYRPHAVLGH